MFLYKYIIKGYHKSSKEHHKFMNNQLNQTSNTDYQSTVNPVNNVGNNFFTTPNNTNYGTQNQNFTNPFEPVIFTEVDHQVNVIIKFINKEQKKAFFKVKLQNINYYVNIQVHNLQPWNFKPLQEYGVLQQLLPILRQSIIQYKYYLIPIGNGLRVFWWKSQQKDMYTGDDERCYFDLKISHT